MIVSQYLNLGKFNLSLRDVYRFHFCLVYPSVGYADVLSSNRQRLIE